MHALELIAEERIRDAVDRGDLDDLPGAGAPLPLDDDQLVPPELRMAYRILKNAGLVPQEVLDRREAAGIEALLARALEPAERSRALARLALLRSRIGGISSACLARYEVQLAEKLARAGDHTDGDARRDSPGAAG